jgi:hypothetical protein
MEYVDLTFEEAMRALTPGFKPALPSDVMSFSTSGSGVDLLSLEVLDRQFTEMGGSQSESDEIGSVDDTITPRSLSRTRHSSRKFRWESQEEEGFDGRRAKDSLLTYNLS